MAKTIEIKKRTIIKLILSFLIGFSILFALNHFGQFSYIANHVPEKQDGKFSFTSYISSDTGVSSIQYVSYFGNEVKTGGNGFNVGDLNFSGTEFQKYSTKSYYYTKATIQDYKYGLYFSFGLFIVAMFFTIFKIKLS